MECAGIKLEEINEVLENDNKYIMTFGTRNILKQYQNKLINNQMEEKNENLYLWFNIRY